MLIRPKYVLLDSAAWIDLAYQTHSKESQRILDLFRDKRFIPWLCSDQLYELAKYSEKSKREELRIFESLDRVAFPPELPHRPIVPGLVCFVHLEEALALMKNPEFGLWDVVESVKPYAVGCMDTGGELLKTAERLLKSPEFLSFVESANLVLECLSRKARKKLRALKESRMGGLQFELGDLNVYFRNKMAAIFHECCTSKLHAEQLAKLTWLRYLPKEFRDALEGIKLGSSDSWNKFEKKLFGVNGQSDEEILRRAMYSGFLDDLDKVADKEPGSLRESLSERGDDFPGWLIIWELTQRATAGGQGAKGSDVVDKRLASMAFYLDAVQVDKRTYEYLRQASKADGHIGRVFQKVFEKVFVYKNLAELYDALVERL
ncbi:hypothetical protein A946_11185 [Methylacidiphilum kamchatkense Kam1]|uniref:PIN domain-containing protein n=1 Tax=Methylacidiphilum kamchatkense Kam1 TaxID=1202785 RepID=A0A0C1V2C8_9BACT|nr:hypothetical protein [Methylacidiphilum kamchatkense]KIE57790.1 hypothetical protein A946_11185 [Methylacidiphilum kamchatkense Kam1]QDQ41498.1 hypothetical protein kam1_243 [Methylacidiphilum kamchatkense Kam1]